MPTVLPGTGSAAPAPAAALDVAAQPAEPITIDLVNPSADELQGLRGAVPGLGVDVRIVSEEVSVQEAIRTLNEPVDFRSTRLESLRDQLRERVRIGGSDVAHAIRQLDGMQLLIDLLKRQEEKKLLMKKIIAQLMGGMLSPSIIAQAKSLGLVGFLKEAIKSLVKQGGMSASAIKAIATMLGQAGIQMPMLDDLVIRMERTAQGDVNAARVAAGQQPTTIGASGDAVSGALQLNPALGAMQGAPA